MTFIITILVGFYCGYKIKGAVLLYKEARNIKYIQAVVNNVLGEKDIQIIKSKSEIVTEKENEALEKEFRIKKYKLRGVTR